GSDTALANAAAVAAATVAGTPGLTAAVSRLTSAEGAYEQAISTAQPLAGEAMIAVATFDLRNSTISNVTLDPASPNIVTHDGGTLMLVDASGTFNSAPGIPTGLFGLYALIANVQAAYDALGVVENAELVFENALKAVLDLECV